MKKLMVLLLLSIGLLSFSLFCDARPVSSSASRPVLAPQIHPVVVSSPVLPPQNQPAVTSPPVFSSTMAAAAAVSPGSGVTKTVHDHPLNKKMLIALIIVSTALCAIVSFLFCLWIYRQKKSHCSDPKKPRRGSTDGVKGLSLGPLLGKFGSMKMGNKKGSVTMIEYQLLEAATDKFNESNILGEGGFGCVYRAHFDDDNLIAAVKRLNCERQDAETEFENEVDLLSKIRHSNIISLLGYCIYGETRFIVYELMHNGSLETQLHGPSHGSALTWHLRMKIALDTARGLEYLHENCNPPVIHRDLKSSNILLDSNFNAKLSDFGLAVASGLQKSNIKLSGTLGYVAPEYILDGKLTEKSDVYAFGVVLLELLMGRRPVEKMTPAQCQSIVTWAMPQLTDRTKLPNIVDPVIRDTMDLKHLYQVAAVAVLCVQPEPSYRPLITDVLHSLVPLVPAELGGTLRVSDPASTRNIKSSA
ncbi:probable receptor-like protein kinase At1g80640 [Papaver somniferum]|uniref:probable receptor-like protein kinase At1g80640 n=1 Tax=Papaver somniferum TaxID=3469 RepID=UPI000E700098|nr:probable receptor-like protein kinase At1g80640 [Papaver somniferum]